MVNILIAGDVCMRGQVDMTMQRGQRILSSIKPQLERADYRILNWENATTREEGAPIPKSGPALASRPEDISFLKAGGFDAVTLANNHTGDYGPAGTMATIKYLREANVAFVGAGENARQACQPIFFEKDGLRIAVLSTCEHEFGIAGDDLPGSNGYSSRMLKDSIQACKKEADYVLVIFHGGNEFNPLPSPQCKNRYRDIIDMGADALIGMHSHCPQGFEIYHDHPIVYGTGNFLFQSRGKAQSDAWHYGYLAMVGFARGSNPSLELIPYQFNTAADSIRPLEGEAKEAMLAYLRTISQAFAEEREHDRMFMGWCMIAGPGYAKQIQYSKDYLTTWDEPALQHVRNLFCCEAHQELMSVYLRMHTERTLAVGDAYAPKVRALQIMPVNVWKDE